jgi:hypothetical protein
MARICSFILVSLVLIGLASSARAELTASLKIGDQVLQLNGAGVRTKTFVQIYESGLYLQKPTKDARAILDAEELMAIRIRIKSSFVSRTTLISSLKDGLVQSTNGRADEFSKEVEILMRSLREEVKANDVYDFVYMPGTGLTVYKNGKIQGTIEGLAFKKAFFGIWLSDSPVDKDLRQAMLSGRSIR